MYCVRRITTKRHFLQATNMEIIFADIIIRYILILKYWNKTYVYY